MSALIESKAYPAAMDHKLRKIRRRLRLFALIRATLLGAAALVVAMLAAMMIDGWFTLFNTGVRAALTTAALAIAVVTLLVSAAKPILASLRLRRAAGHVDERVPQLEERWTTVAALAESNDQPQTPHARAMFRQVTAEAVAMGRLVEPARVVPPDRLRRPALLLAGCAALLAAFIAVRWEQHRILALRFWSPLSEISATQVQSVTGDVLVPRGEPVDLVFRLSGQPREAATVEIAAAGEQVETVELTSADGQPGVFTHHVPALAASFRYRAQAGDGRTAWRQVTAIDRPALAEVRCVLEGPAYVDLPKYEKNYLPERMRAMQGSRLKLAMRPAAALKRFELLLTGETDDDAQSLTLRPDAEGWYRFEMRAGKRFVA